MVMNQTSEHNKKLLSDTEYRQDWISSMYRYWGEEGLSKKEIEEKIQEALEDAKCNEIDRHYKKLHSNQEYRENWEKSMYGYWREKGLSDDEIQKKIDQELKQKAE